MYRVVLREQLGMGWWLLWRLFGIYRVNLSEFSDGVPDFADELVIFCHKYSRFLYGDFQSYARYSEMLNDDH